MTVLFADVKGSNRAEQALARADEEVRGRPIERLLACLGVEDLSRVAETGRNLAASFPELLEEPPLEPGANSRTHRARMRRPPLRTG